MGRQPTRRVSAPAVLLQPRSAARRAAARAGDLPQASCRATSGRIVRIRGGRFRVGDDAGPLPQDGESPSRTVTIKPFAIDPLRRHQRVVLEFVDCHRLSHGRGTLRLVAGVQGVRADAAPVLWIAAMRRHGGAAWRAPAGAPRGAALQHCRPRAITPSCTCPGTTPSAFAAWAGGRLPTEAEWECAARGGLTEARFPWGDREPDDTPSSPATSGRANFRVHNAAPDGYAGTAPVDAFAPNGYGLFNMAGNTWEWCADAFRVRSLARAAARAQRSRARCRRARAEGRLVSLPSLLLLPLSHRRAHRRQRRQLHRTCRLPPRVRRLATRSPAPPANIAQRGHLCGPPISS